MTAKSIIGKREFNKIGVPVSAKMFESFAKRKRNKSPVGACIEKKTTGAGEGVALSLVSSDSYRD